MQTQNLILSVEMQNFASLQLLIRFFSKYTRSVNKKKQGLPLKIATTPEIK
jgi:hypothetical protein